jgi:hypothetical protein
MEYIESLPKTLKNQIITGYLFLDIFTQFRRFFMVDSILDARFLYECGLGFMPRRFSPTSDDKIIYREEDDVPELYFITEGIVGIAFRLISGCADKEKREIIGKRMQGGPKASVIICDHYVVNDCKSQFMYIAHEKEVKCFALTKNFMRQVFAKYPKFQAKISAETYKIYKKQIFKPLNERRKVEIIKLNKKSMYKNIELIDLNDKHIKQKSLFPPPVFKSHTSYDEEIKEQGLSEEMIEMNISNNLNSLDQEFQKVK